MGRQVRWIAAVVLGTISSTTLLHAADKPIKAFILAGQSNMVGYGDSTKEYLDNLKSVVAAVRKDTGVPDLPFIYGSARQEGIPDDLTDSEEPTNLPPGRPGAWLMLKGQFDAQKEIPHSKMVILRDIEKHPQNAHYNTAGQMVVGKLFAEPFLGQEGNR